MFSIVKMGTVGSSTLRREAKLKEATEKLATNLANETAKFANLPPPIPPPPVPPTKTKNFNAGL